MTRLASLLAIVGTVVAAAGGYWLGVRHADSSISDVRPRSSDEMRAARRALLAAAEDSNREGESRTRDDVRENKGASRDKALSDESIGDPRQAVTAALALPRGDARRSQLTRIARTWTRTAPEEAWQYGSNLPDPIARRAFQNAVIAEWASAQPERAFATVAELPAEWERDQLLRPVVTEIARRDPHLAINLLTTVELADSDSMHTLIVDEWARYDPSAAAQWVETQERRLQARLAYQMASSYVSQQPSEALAWALRISRSPGRNLWAYMVGQLALENPQEALRLAQAADNPMQRTQALGAVLGTIAKRDPALAMSHLEKLPAGRMRSQASAQIAAQMAETAPAAAIDWAISLDDRQARLESVMQIGYMLTQRDVDSAAQLLDRVPAEARPSWIQHVANAYAEYDIEKGIQWIRKHQDEPGYTNMVGQFAYSLAQRNPDAALDLVDRTMSGKQRDQALSQVIPAVATQAPETATRWIREIVDANTQVTAIQSTASMWANYDASAAGKWVMSLQPGPGRDAGLSQLIQHGAAPIDETLTLIGQIQSQDQRMSAVMNAAMRLAPSDPEGARTILRRYPLDPMRRHHFDEMMKQQGVVGW